MAPSLLLHAATSPSHHATEREHEYCQGHHAVEVRALLEPLDIESPSIPVSCGQHSLASSFGGIGRAREAPEPRRG